MAIPERDRIRNQHTWPMARDAINPNADKDRHHMSNGIRGCLFSRRDMAVDISIGHQLRLTLRFSLP